MEPTSRKKPDHPKAGILTTLELKVIPGASRSEIVGWLGDTLKVKVAAPPEKGKANAAVEVLVARALNLPASSVGIVSGTNSQHKVIRIRGLAKDEILKKLSVPAV